MALLILAAIFVHTRWAALLTLPALLLARVFFLADLQFWLANFGQNLDPTAPLSSSVNPFVPPVLWTGQDRPVQHRAAPRVGLWLAIVGVGADPSRALLPPSRVQAAGGGKAE